MSDAFDASSGDLTSVRAIFQTVVLTALVDGRPALSEARVVADLLALDPRFGGIADAIELGVQARALLDQHGIEEALEQIVRPIGEADRALTFRLCVRVMIADGKTEGDEAMVLGTLQELFAIAPAAVRSCLDEERVRKAAKDSQ